MDVRDGLRRKLSTEELMLLNCGVGEDSWESLGLHGDPTSPFYFFFLISATFLSCKLNFSSCTKAYEIGFLRLDPVWPTENGKSGCFLYRKIFNKPKECFSQDTGWTLSFASKRPGCWFDLILSHQDLQRKDKSQPRQYISICFNCLLTRTQK